MGIFGNPGRGTVKSAAGTAGDVAQTGLNLGKQYSGLQSGYRSAGDTTAKQLFSMPANGGLNPYLANQFAAEKSQIAKSYADPVAAAQKGLAMRGMSVAPTGLSASITNTANQNEGAAETGAYNQQLQNQLGLGLQGIKYNQEQQQLYDPTRPLNLAAGAAGTQGQLGQIQGTMGNGLGDILKAASMFAAV